MTREAYLLEIENVIAAGLKIRLDGMAVPDYPLCFKIEMD